MQRIILFFIIIYLSFHFNITSLGQSYPTPGEISIVASTPIPDGIIPTPESYKDLVDCGFNMGMTNGSLDYFQNQFKLIGNLNFRYIIQNNDLLTSRRGRFIEALKNNPHFGGWKFVDEPKYEELSQLSKIYKELYKADSTSLIYINLTGLVLKSVTGPCKTFAEYLKVIEKDFSPQIWSYDLYPIYYRNNKLQIDYDFFYTDLEVVSAIARKTGRPFWAYCESMAYDSKSYSRPAATEAYLKFEAFSALAYGAQGIVYWTYGQRYSNASEKYLSALVNLDGKKSPAWYAAQKVNREIKKFNHVFYKGEVKEVKHTGSKLYNSTQRLSGGIGPFRSVKSGNSGVVVSRILNNDKEYVIIVSRDIQKNQKITLNLKTGKSVKQLDYSDNDKTFNSVNDISVNLEKGGYLIFQTI